jgi:hypothetical protein
VQGSGFEYRGTVFIGTSWGESRLFLTQYGGPEDGRTWTLGLRPYS